MGLELELGLGLKGSGPGPGPGSGPGEGARLVVDELGIEDVEQLVIGRLVVVRGVVPAADELFVRLGDLVRVRAGLRLGLRGLGA